MKKEKICLKCKWCSVPEYWDKELKFLKCNHPKNMKTFSDKSLVSGKEVVYIIRYFDFCSTHRSQDWTSIHIMGINACGKGGRWFEPK